MTQRERGDVAAMRKLANEPGTTVAQLIEIVHCFENNKTLMQDVVRNPNLPPTYWVRIAATIPKEALENPALTSIYMVENPSFVQTWPEVLVHSFLTYEGTPLWLLEIFETFVWSIKGSNRNRECLMKHPTYPDSYRVRMIREECSTKEQNQWGEEHKWELFKAIRSPMVMARFLIREDDEDLGFSMEVQWKIDWPQPWLSVLVKLWNGELKEINGVGVTLKDLEAFAPYGITLENSIWLRKEVMAGEGASDELIEAAWAVPQEDYDKDPVLLDLLLKRQSMPARLQKELLKRCDAHMGRRAMLFRMKSSATNEERVSWSKEIAPQFKAGGWEKIEFCLSVMAFNEETSPGDIDWLVHARIWAGKEPRRKLEKILQAQPYWVKLALSLNSSMLEDYKPCIEVEKLL